ncbi:MAG: NAD(P)/FAD-dependent oxidoreductase [Oscillospiraceae bacterium]|nr:NAD(P)/FAD-dependent oxidoreductase [Bacteroidales bacterium]MDD6998959.1 NAD(P)/FAD-dependent oxidoreductase [Oscillospiraceae bacterium]MDY5096269.1 NAD(P)/FAD-dependent oxidoreductase [Oscillospiraceae bacterium]
MGHLIVVGAGAAGLMAAGAALEQGHTVTLLEHEEKPGKKILVTGKGRCNVTNDCDLETFLQNVRTNPRFLYSAFSAFDTAAAMALFEGLGVPLKVERGRRVFPVSDRAEDIRRALVRYAAGAELRTEEVTKLLLEEGRCVGVSCQSGRQYRGDWVLVATGGVSYPGTGSRGAGYALARQAGHTVRPPVPSLVSLVAQGGECRRMMGLALKNVGLTLYQDGKSIFQEQGEALFTHFGLSGPLVLSASAHLGDLAKHRYEVGFDLKPALSHEQLYARLNRDLTALANRDAANCLVKLLPASMQPVMVERWGVDPAKKANQLTKEERLALVDLMKDFRIRIRDRGDLEHAVITSGGVAVKEVDPRTMASKKCPGLYFAGEVLDVDAYTGGYNLQIAWCTAQAAARGLA